MTRVVRSIYALDRELKLIQNPTQFLWTLLIMSLVGNMIAEAFAGNPSSINYTMFLAAFSMLSLLYLGPASFNPDWAIHPIIMIVLDVLNCIFFFCAAIALAAKLECHSCSNTVRHVKMDNQMKIKSSF